MATLIDQALDLHARMIGGLFNRAKRRYAEGFQQSNEAIARESRLYLARWWNFAMKPDKSGIDPFPAVEAALPWESVVQSVTEAQWLAQGCPESSDELKLTSLFCPLSLQLPSVG